MPDRNSAATAFPVAGPALLVFISSTSFIAARAVAPNADPILFLLVRFLLVAVGFALLARRVAWPKAGQIVGHLLAGMIISGVYLVASWWAVAHGLSAGVMTLLGSLQPLFAALAATLLLRRGIGYRTWLGLGFGLAGVALVLSPRLQQVDAAGVPLLPVAIGLVGIISLTVGTMMQKSSLAEADLRAAGSVQHLGAAIVAAVALPLFGTGQWNNVPSLWLSLGWSVIGLSLAGTSLFIWLVRRGDVTRVTSLMLLVPPATALQAWFLFEERLTIVQIAGFAVTLIGVVIVQRTGSMPRSVNARHEAIAIGRAFNLRWRPK